MSSNSTTTFKESVDGLPKQFVSSLRILFDILDETRSGFIRLRDIESRWSDDGVRGLPPGVIDGLKKVTPPNGLLSFDRFVAGLKLVLIKKRDDTDVRKPLTSKENRTPQQEYNNTGERTYQLRDVNSNKFVNDARHADKPPNNISNREYDNLHQHRNQRPQYLSHSNTMKFAEHYDGRHHHEDHRSPPLQASKLGSVPRGVSHNAYVIKPEVSNYSNAVGSHHPPPNSAGVFRQGISSNQQPHPQERDRAPAVPPRTERPPQTTSYSSQMRKSVSGPNLASHSHSPPAVPPRGQPQNKWALSDLKTWQRESMVTQTVDSKYGNEKMPQPTRNSNQDNAIYANIEQFQRRKEGDLKTHLSGPQKATVQRHGSGRRHTLANGIDQNMVKRMSQLEEETSLLRSGLAMVDSAREWYMKQLSLVSDKQAMIGKVTYNDNSVEAHQERMNFQRARITEINQHLQTLLESSEKGFPIHMNLAVSSSASKTTDNITLQRLREQNRKLLEDVEQRKEQVSQLEMEKASLVRDLFEVRSKNSSGHDDTTFM